MIIVVVDEETTSQAGAGWLCNHHPELVRCDYLVNEGGGASVSVGARRVYGVACAEKGFAKVTVTAHGDAAHASIPGLGDNALLRLEPATRALASGGFTSDVVPEAAAYIRALGEDPSDPVQLLSRLRRRDRRLAAVVESLLGVTFAPTRITASESINVIPAKAVLEADCRLPPGHGESLLKRRLAERMPTTDGLDVTLGPIEVGNGSPADTPLMGAIRTWLDVGDPAGVAVPTVFGAYTDSRVFREAFPDCVAYGFFPQRHFDVTEVASLLHAANERIDVRDLELAAGCYRMLPKILLSD